MVEKVKSLYFEWKNSLQVEKPKIIYVDESKIYPALNCSMCLEIFENPKRLGCAHVFCHKCIFEWIWTTACEKNK